MLTRRGITLHVINSVFEGRLGFLSASSDIDLSRGTTAVFDIGGGSAQVVIAIDGVVCKCNSAPIGAVRITQLFGGPDAIARKNFQRASGYIDRQLEEIVLPWEIWPRTVIGTGGTMSSLQHVAALRRLEAHMKEHKQRPLSRTDDLQRIMNDMRGLKVSDRGMYLGLHADRADIFLTGLLVADRVLELLESPSVRVHEGGIRDGALIHMSRGGEFEQNSGDPVEAANQLRRRTDDDMPHSSHVAKLALSLAKQLGRIPASDMRLLDLAARLHDIGQFVEYEEHHRYSAEMIRAACLPGLSHEEVEIVACVARYHRKAIPELSHFHYGRLAARDRRRVDVLAAVLRLADALDRSHRQKIRAVRLSRSRGEWKIACTCSGSISRELDAAEEKSSLWRRVFGPVTVDV
jgi:exopolyphosphatase/guanosine-5'-triphosphate,3'-diphosphate pyrophosphatase